MLAAVLDLDGVTGVEIFVKTVTYATCLVAAGSALTRLALSRPDDDTARAVARLAVAAAVSAAVLSVLRIPVRASFLMGGTLSGALDPAILGMVVESPLGTSLWVRLAGLALVCLVVVDGRRARVAAGYGAALVCASFALRGHTLDEPRLVLGLLVTLHLLGLAFWIGIFAPLHRLASRDAEAAGALAAEFGAWAVRIVLALVATGAALFVTLTADPPAALDTPYGQLLAVKLLAFAPLLAVKLLAFAPASPRSTSSGSPWPSRRGSAAPAHAFAGPSDSRPSSSSRSSRRPRPSPPSPPRSGPSPRPPGQPDRRRPCLPPRTTMGECS